MDYGPRETSPNHRTNRAMAVQLVCHLLMIRCTRAERGDAQRDEGDHGSGDRGRARSRVGIHSNRVYTRNHRPVISTIRSHNRCISDSVGIQCSHFESGAMRNAVAPPRRAERACSTVFLVVQPSIWSSYERLCPDLKNLCQAKRRAPASSDRLRPRCVCIRTRNSNGFSSRRRPRLFLRKFAAA